MGLCLKCWNQSSKRYFFSWEVKRSWRHKKCDRCGQQKRIVMSTEMGELVKIAYYIMRIRRY